MDEKRKKRAMGTSQGAMGMGGTQLGTGAPSHRSEQVGDPPGTKGAQGEIASTPLDADPRGSPVRAEPQEQDREESR